MTDLDSAPSGAAGQLTGPDRVELGASPDGNAQVLQQALSRGPATVQLPAGCFAVSGGLRLDQGQHLVGQPGGSERSATRLRFLEAAPEPCIHVLGSAASISDLTVELPASGAGEHDGDLGTAITVGRYLYPQAPQWIGQVRLERIVVLRTGPAVERGLAANSVAIMGAVRRVEVEDLQIRGGGTGLALHWGAVGSSVQDISGPSYHPHDVRVRRLSVAEAVEGFYLSSVHDVSVEQVDLDRVEIGFRLLPGDNTARFATTDPPAPVSSRIEVTDCRIAWHGCLYALRIAGWGRSPVDDRVTRLPYSAAAVRRCHISARTGGHRPGCRAAAIVLEQAHGIVLEDVTFDAGPGMDLVRSDGTAPGRLTGFSLD